MTNHTSLFIGTALLATGLCAVAQVPASPQPPSGPPPGLRPPIVEHEPGKPNPPTAINQRRYVETHDRTAAERSRTLVIPAKKTDSKNLALLEEDLNVMARILEKAANLENDPFRRAMGITLQSSLFGNTTGPRNLYLEGYGALFLLNVPFPLAPSAAGTREVQAEGEENSEWEMARRELQSGSPGAVALDFSAITKRLGPTQPYDQARVEELKTGLLNALKNAVHIRGLQPEEQVLVVVTGTRAQPGPKPPGVVPDEEEDVRSPANRNAPDRLLIQARHGDIEAFQKGTLNLEDFKKKVQVRRL